MQNTYLIHVLQTCISDIYRRGRENLGQYEILDIVKLINTFLHI